MLKWPHRVYGLDKSRKLECNRSAHRQNCCKSTSVQQDRGAAVLVCAVILNYLGTVVSLQQRLSLLRTSHKTGLVFSFSNEKLRWSSCSPCETA